MKNRIKGVYPAIVTPFDTEGRVNEKVLGDLVEYHIAAGVDGFYVCGGTGLGLLLNIEERNTVLRKVVEQTDGRVRVMAHVGAMNTRDAVILAKDAAAIGADFLSALSPLIYSVGSRAVADYYRAIAGAADLPMIGYYNPEMTGVAHSQDEIADLLTIENMAGLKFSDNNLYLMQQVIESFPEAVIMSGQDHILLPALTMGCNGFIGLTTNFMPALYVKLYKAFGNGDYKLAGELQFQANRIIKVMLTTFPVSAVLYVMDMLGFPCGKPRPPLGPLNNEEYKKLRDQLDESGLFSIQSI